MVAVPVATGFPAMALAVMRFAIDKFRSMVMADIDVEIDGPCFGTSKKCRDGKNDDHQAHGSSITYEALQLNSMVAELPAQSP